jgi:hypothetical protein
MNAWPRPAGLVLAAVLLAGCGSASGPAPAPREPPAPQEPPDREPVAFTCVTTEGVSFDSRAARGQATAVLLLTTYDMDLQSQAEARRLDHVLRTLRPPASAVGLVLEEEQNVVLADVYRTTLGLSFPLCMADEQTRAGEGPFGRIDRVPTLVVLDRSGAPVWRKEGLSSAREMKQALTLASRHGTPPGP